MEKKIDAT